MTLDMSYHTCNALFCSCSLYYLSNNAGLVSVMYRNYLSKVAPTLREKHRNHGINILYNETTFWLNDDIHCIKYYASLVYSRGLVFYL